MGSYLRRALGAACLEGRTRSRQATISREYPEGATCGAIGSRCGQRAAGVAVWRFGTLPRWSGAAWAFAQVMYVFGLVYAMTSAPRPPLRGAGRSGAAAIGGAWIVYRSFAAFSTGTVGGVQAPTTCTTQHLRRRTGEQAHGIRNTEKETAHVHGHQKHNKNQQSTTIALRRWWPAPVLVLVWCALWGGLHDSSSLLRCRRLFSSLGAVSDRADASWDGGHGR